MTRPERTDDRGLTAAIPTTGDRPELRRAVEALIRSAEMAGTDAEVLVVVNGRRSVPMLDYVGSPLLRVLFLDRRNVSLARNTAILNAQHDTILFTDDDAVVGLDWCADLRAGLDRPGCAVVAGPVRVPVSGPVTALLDYQRPFDAEPDGNGGVVNVVTVNCGIRRDRLPEDVRFAEVMVTGQDVDFGQLARARGAEMSWLADSVPVRHVLSDRFDEIGKRFLAYGAAIAMITLRRQPATADKMTSVFSTIYRAMTQAGSAGFRQFTEFASPRVRDTLTVLDYLLTASFFVGYLRRMSAEMDSELITVDDQALYAALAHIADSVLADAREHMNGDWEELRPDYALLGNAPGAQPPAIDQIKAALAQYARPAPGQVAAAQNPAAQNPAAQNPAAQNPAAQNPAALNPAALNPAALNPAGQRQGVLRVPPGQARARAAWQELPVATELITTADLERALRSAGVTFREGCRQIEAMLMRERSGVR
jgi:hypothetical protein